MVTKPQNFIFFDIYFLGNIHNLSSAFEENEMIIMRGLILDAMHKNYSETEQPLAIERFLPRESILMLLSTTYQEITAQSNQVLDELKFEISKETQEILKKEI